MNQAQKIQIYKQCIADYYGANPEDICTKKLKRPIPMMRKMLCFALGIKMNMEAVRIAEIVYPSGDHSNVYDALTTLSKYTSTDLEIRSALRTIIENIDQRIKKA